MQKFRNILIPTDLSINSTTALDYALTLAEGAGTIIHLLHCIEVVPTMFNRGPKMQKVSQDTINKTVKDLKRYRESIPTSDATIIEVVKTGTPYDQILNYASDNKIDLIILTTHGTEESMNSVMGPVAEKVARYADIPVILIKSSILPFQNDYRPGNSTVAENWVR